MSLRPVKIVFRLEDLSAHRLHSLAGGAPRRLDGCHLGREGGADAAAILAGELLSERTRRGANNASIT